MLFVHRTGPHIVCTLVGAVDGLCTESYMGGKCHWHTAVLYIVCTQVGAIYCLCSVRMRFMTFMQEAALCIVFEGAGTKPSCAQRCTHPSHVQMIYRTLTCENYT